MHFPLALLALSSLSLAATSCSSSAADLVFGSSRTGQGDLYRLDPSGGGAPRLWIRSPTPDFNPRWDAARGRLVFLREGDDDEIEQWAWRDGVVESAGPYLGDEEPADWSPDGSACVYSVTRDGNRDIYLFDGQNEVRLTTAPGPDLQPRWSPDSQTIAFVSARSGNRDVWLMSRDGRDLRNATSTLADEGHPSWSPAGDALLYDADDTRDGLPDIFVHVLASGTRTNVTDAAGVDLIAEWSPDGEWIAFGSSRAGNWDVYIVKPDGSELRQVTTAPEFDGDPKWVPRR